MLTESSPEQEPKGRGSENASASGQGAPSKETAQRPSPPKEVLPTERIAFDKQLQLLRAYAAASDDGNAAVTNDHVAKIVSMQPSTVSLANNFFVKTGFLIKSGRSYIPTKEVLDFLRAEKWKSDTAAHKLAPILERSWFVQTLKPTLQFRPMEEADAVTELAHRAEATPSHRAQLRTLLDYMEAAGIIRRENGQITMVPRAADSHQVSEPETPRQESHPPSQTQLGTDGRGAVHFAINVNVSLDEMAKWTPDRISAFFAGLAQVLAAQKGEG